MSGRAVHVFHQSGVECAVQPDEERSVGISRAVADPLHDRCHGEITARRQAGLLGHDQCLPQLIGGQVRTIGRGARLVTPGVRERTGVDRVEADLVEQLDGDLLVIGIVPGHRQR